MSKSKNTFYEKLYLYAGFIWSRKLWILFLTGFCMVCTMAYTREANQHKACGILSLRYERAYEGQYPNGTRFNIYDLKDGEVLQKTLERAGLAEEMTPNMLAECISLSPASAQNVYRRYLATDYSVTLRDDYLPKGYSPSDVLNLLLCVYEEVFHRNYATNDDSLELDWSEVREWDYLEFGNFMKLKVDKLITYLDELRSSSGMSQYSMDGETFNSLRASVVNFRNIYLDAYNSFIWEKRLFRDSENYREKLEYSRFQAHQQIEQFESKYEINQDAQELYDSAMITFVMVPMYDQVHGLYMARTEIGMDKLALDSEKDASSLRASKLRMEEIEDQLDRVSHKSSLHEDRQKADEMILNIQRQADALIARIRVVTKNYEDNRSKNDITHWISDGSFMHRFGVRYALAVGVGTAAAILLFYWLTLDGRKTKT